MGEEGIGGVASVQDIGLQQFHLNEDADDQNCSICNDGTVYVNNEIIFCEKCNIAVHQNCYGVEVIPDDDWYCDICRSGGDPSSIKCALCPHTGGAYKPTTVKDEWVHVICATWVPEVFTPVFGLYDVSLVSRDRFRLKCSLCKGKGAVIQCSYGRCCGAAHPWCALRKGSGFTSRIVPNPFDNNNLLWEVFCKTHCNAVSDPVKPKVKAKQTTSVAVDNNDVPNGESLPNTVKKSAKKKSENGTCNIISAGRKKKLASTPADYDSDDSTYSRTWKQKSTEKINGHKRQRVSASKVRFSNPDYDSDAEFEAMIGGDYVEEAKPSVVHNSSDINLGNGHNGPPFSLVTLSEWKGQSEGEPLGLDHFWNHVTTMFPEDQSQEWLEFMTKALLLTPDNPHYEEYVSTIPPLGSAETTLLKMIRGDEDVLTSMHTGSNLNAIFDEDKRNLFHDAVWQYISLLGSTESPSIRTSHATGTLDVGGLRISGSDTINGDDCISTCDSLVSKKFAETNVDYVTRRKIRFDGFDDSMVTPVDSHSADNVTCLEVLFASAVRQSATFQVRIADCDKADVKKWHQVSLKDTCKLNSSELFARLGVLGPRTDFLSPIPDSPPPHVHVALNNTTVYPEKSHARLLDRELIARDEEDEISELIRADSKLFQMVVKAMSRRCESLIKSEDFCKISEIRSQRRITWEDDRSNIEKFRRQRAWGRVCRGILLGVKDQGEDFNKPKEELVPASWTLQVAGRPMGKVAEPKSPVESNLDALCMCCFDGGIHEANNILFCDGCNATMHQACYGVKEVPEGDYFCDRCQYLKDLELVSSLAEKSPGISFRNAESLKDAVKCCLCPVYHGALKKTVDGQWVHVCCAIWSGLAVFDDVTEIQRIDISKALEKIKLTSLNPVVSDGKAVMKNGNGELQVPNKSSHLSASVARTASHLNDDSRIQQFDAVDRLASSSSHCTSPLLPPNRMSIANGSVAACSLTAGAKSQAPSVINTSVAVAVVPDTTSQSGGSIIFNNIQVDSAPTGSKIIDSKEGRPCPPLLKGDILMDAADNATINHNPTRIYENVPDLSTFIPSIKIESKETSECADLSEVESVLRGIVDSALDTCESGNIQADCSTAAVRSAIVKSEVQLKPQVSKSANVNPPKPFPVVMALPPTAPSSNTTPINSTTFPSYPQSNISRNLKGHVHPISSSKSIEIPTVLKTELTYPTCIYCKKRSGLLLGCCYTLPDGSGGQPCRALFHPLCAWFEGAYVTSELTDPTFLGEDCGGKYPSGINFRFHCENHIPEGMTTSWRSRQKALRGLYKIKLADLCRFPSRCGGRGSIQKNRGEKEKKKKRDSIESCNTPSVSRSSSKISKDNNLDVYRPSLCAACLLPLRNIQVGEHVNGLWRPLPVRKTEVVMKCSMCQHLVHSACVGVWPSDVSGMRKVGSSNISNESPIEKVHSNSEVASYSEIPCSYHCEACKSTLMKATPTTSSIANASSTCMSASGVSAISSPILGSQGGILPEARCIHCNRKGGAFKSVGGNRWEHFFCARHPVAPRIQVLQAVNAVTPLRPAGGNPKPLKCMYCKQKDGSLGKCRNSQCGKVFHPLCAAIRHSNTSYVQSFEMDPDGYCFQYCESHIPGEVMKVLGATGEVWLDTSLEQKWRRPFESAMLILDRIIKREKLKTRFYRNSSELFNEESELLLQNIRSGGLDAHSIENISETTSIDIFPEDLLAKFPLAASPESTTSGVMKRPVGRPPSKKGVKISNIPVKKEEVDSPAAPLSGEFVISFSGQELVSIDTKRYSDLASYTQEVTHRIFKNMDTISSGDGDSKFSGQRDLLAFERSLALTIKTHLKMPFEELMTQLAGDYKPNKVAKKRERSSSLEEITAAESGTTAVRISKLTPYCSDVVDSIVAVYQNVRVTQRNEKNDEPALKRTRHKTSCSDQADFGSIVSSKVQPPQPTVSLLLLNPLHMRQWSLLSSPEDVCHLEQTLMEFLSVLETCEIPAGVDPLFNDSASSATARQFTDLLWHRLNQGISLSDWSAWDGELDIEKIEKKYAKLKASHSVPRRKLSLRKSKSSSGYGSSVPDEKEGISSKKNECSRLLSEDFSDIPYDVIPEYNTLVVRPISFSVIKEKVQAHEYISLYGFSKDVFEMLNNGRSITTPGSKTWFDSTVLATLFEQLVNLLQEGRLSVVASPPPVSVIYESTDGDGDEALIDAAGNGCAKECPICVKQFILSGYPTAFSFASAPRKATRRKCEASTSISEWCWLCPSCVESLAVELVSCAVRIWWSGDDRYYEGVLKDYDSLSGRHRVQYSEDEWEFLRLSGEGFVIRIIPDELKELTRIVDVKNRNSTCTDESSRKKQKVL